MKSLHAVVLVAFCALLGLVEGPAQIACVAAVLTSLYAARHRDRTTLLILGGIGLWALAGVYGTATAGVKLRSEDIYRPLLALAFLAGAFGLREADDRTLRRAALAFCACIAFNGAYGFLQLAFGELPLDKIFLKNPHSSQIWVPGHAYDHTQANPSGVRVLSGLFYNRLKLAHLGVVGLGTILIVARAATSARRYLALAAGAILFVAVLLTYARLAIVAFVVAAGVLALLSMKKRVAFLVTALPAAAIGLTVLSSRFAQERVARAIEDLGHRRAILGASWRIFADHPILGIGHGVYPAKSAAYHASDVSAAWLIDAHNLLLHVAAESGILGIVGFFGAVVLALGRVVRRVRQNQSSNAEKDVLDRVALFGVVAILVLGITHFPLHHGPVALAFWTLLGVAGGRERADGER